MSKFNLVSMHLKNFKKHQDLNVPFVGLNEVFGKNRTGKTTIVEALKFCLQGGKSDVDKIHLGGKSATVTSTWKEAEKNTELVIKTTINDKGDVRCSAVFDGIKHHKPRTFIKQLVGVGSFDPRELLDKKGRQENLLKLVPLTVKEEDLVMPEIKDKEGKPRPFPIHDKGSIDFSRHAFLVLNDIEKDLKNTRLSLYQRKDLLSKSYEDAKNDLNNREMKFDKEFSMSPYEAGDYEKLQQKLGKLKAEAEKSKEAIEK